MKISTRRTFAAAAIVALSLACASGEPAPPRTPPASGHGYALLYEILGQEAKVSQLLMIKTDREAFGNVIKSIADICGAARDRLEELAQQSPRLDLEDTGLPKDELRARELIGSMRRDLLLASSGPELELQLLLIQNEALTYAANLADVLSRSEPDPERLAYLRALWKDLTRLLSDVQALLRRPVRTVR